MPKDIMQPHLKAASLPLPPSADFLPDDEEVLLQLFVFSATLSPLPAE